MHSPAKWRCCAVCDVVSAFHFNYSMKARLRYSIGLFSMLCMGWSWNSPHFVSLCIQTINSPTTTEHRTTEKNSRKWIDGWFLILQPCKNYSYQLWKYRHILFQLSHTHTPTHTHKAKKKKPLLFKMVGHIQMIQSHIFFFLLFPFGHVSHILFLTILCCAICEAILLSIVLPIMLS